MCYAEGSKQIEHLRQLKTKIISTKNNVWKVVYLKYNMTCFMSSIWNHIR